MRWTSLVMASVLATAPACTVISMGAGAGITGIHNASVAEGDGWGYTAPMLAGALVGLAGDITLFLILKRQWSKPMS